MKLSKKAFKDAIIADKDIMIAGDGFRESDAVISRDYLEVEYHGKRQLELSVTFKQRAICEPDVVNHIMSKMADNFHYTLYGWIARSLQEIRYRAETSSKDEVLAMLDTLASEICE